MEPPDELGVVKEEMPASKLNESKRKLQEFGGFQEQKRQKVGSRQSDQIELGEVVHASRNIQETANKELEKEYSIPNTGFMSCNVAPPLDEQPGKEHTIENARLGIIRASQSPQFDQIKSDLRQSLDCNSRLNLDLNMAWHEAEDFDTESPSLPQEVLHSRMHNTELRATITSHNSPHVAKDGIGCQKDVWSIEAVVKQIEATQVVRAIHRPRLCKSEGPANFPGAIGTGKGDVIKGCDCCKKPEGKRNTIICDGCEGSFHLSCSNLRYNVAVELQDWTCGTCMTRCNYQRWPLGKIRRNNQNADFMSIDRTVVTKNDAGTNSVSTDISTDVTLPSISHGMNSKNLQLNGHSSSSCNLDEPQKLGTSLDGLAQKDCPFQEHYQGDAKQENKEDEVSISFGSLKSVPIANSTSRSESPHESIQGTRYLKSSLENQEDQKFFPVTGPQNTLAGLGSNITNLEKSHLYVEIGADAQTVEHFNHLGASVQVGDRGFRGSGAEKFEKAYLDFVSTDEELKRFERNAMQGLIVFIQEKNGFLGEGWRVEVKRRKKESSSTYDKTFYSPDGQKFRSRVEVARFLGLLNRKPDKVDGLAYEAEHSLQDVDVTHKPVYVDGVEGCGAQLVVTKASVSPFAGCADLIRNQVSVQLQHSGPLGKQSGSRKRKTDGFNDRLKWHAQSCKAAEGLQPPLLCADSMILTLGVVDSRPNYHDETHIWPVGYRVTWHSAQVGSLFLGEVLDGGISGPIFRITRKCCSTVPHQEDFVATNRPGFNESILGKNEKHELCVSAAEANVEQNSGDNDILVQLHTKEVVMASLERASSYPDVAGISRSQIDNEDELQLHVLLGGFADSQISNCSWNEAIHQRSTSNSTAVPATRLSEREDKNLPTVIQQLGVMHAAGSTGVMDKNYASDIGDDNCVLTCVPVETGGDHMQLSVPSESIAIVPLECQHGLGVQGSKQKRDVDEKKPDNDMSARLCALEQDRIPYADISIMSAKNGSCEKVKLLPDRWPLFSLFDVVAEGITPDEAWMKLTRLLVENFEGSIDLSKQYQQSCAHSRDFTKLAFACNKVGNLLEVSTDRDNSTQIELCQQKQSKSCNEAVLNPEANQFFLLNKLGSHQFCLDNPVIQTLIEALPGSDRCVNYKFLGQRGLNIGSERFEELCTLNVFGCADEPGKDRKEDGNLKDALEKEKRPPPPPGELIGKRFPPELVGDLVEVFEFLSRFAEVLGLKEPTILDELEEALLSPFFGDDSKSQLELNYWDSSAAVIGEQLPSDNAQKGSSVRLASIHIHLLQLLVSDFQNKYTLSCEMEGELEDTKSKRRRPTLRSAERSSDYEIKGHSLPLNLLTWPEVARRYITALLADRRNAQSTEIGQHERFKIMRCLQGDGGILCGAITGLSGADADAQFLAEAERKLSGKPPAGMLKTQEMDRSEMGNPPNCENKNSEPWVSILEPVAKLPTNVGSRIKNRVLEAIAAGAPDWAKEVLERSIQKDVYKSNAAGQTKNAVLSVLGKFHGKEIVPKRRKKSIKKPSSPDYLMRRCRLILRHMLSLDQCQAFLSFLQGTIPGSFLYDGESSEKVVQLVARPLDFRTVDLRLAAEAYGESHEAFAADVRQIWSNVHLVYPIKSEAVELAKFLSEVFESLYTEQIVNSNKAHEPGDNNSKVARLEKSGPEEMVNSSLSMELFSAHVKEQGAEMTGEFPKAPWEEDGVCKVCGIDEDDDHVLLCDSCDAEYHIYCLTPQLTKIPEGNWYCPSCVGVGKALLEAVPAAESGFVDAEKVSDDKITEENDSALQSHILNVLRHLADELGERDYWELSLADRVSLLKLLCDNALETQKLREHLEKCSNTSLELQQKLRLLTVERRNCAAVSSLPLHCSTDGLNIAKAISSQMSNSGSRDSSEPKLDEVVHLAVMAERIHHGINRREDASASKQDNSGILSAVECNDVEYKVRTSVNGVACIKEGVHTDNHSGKVSFTRPTSVDGRVFTSVGRGTTESTSIGQRVNVSSNHGVMGVENRLSARELERMLNEGLSFGNLAHEKRSDVRPMDFDHSQVTSLELAQEENAFTSNVGTSPSQKYAHCHLREANMTAMMNPMGAQGCGLLEDRRLLAPTDTGKKALVHPPFEKGLIQVRKPQEVSKDLVLGDGFISSETPKKSLHVLDKEILQIQRKLLDVCPRRELMGRDDFGRLYWALGLPNKGEWLVVQERKPDSSVVSGIGILDEVASLADQEFKGLSMGTTKVSEKVSLGVQSTKFITSEKYEAYTRMGADAIADDVVDKRMTFRWLSYNNQEDIDMLFKWLSSSIQHEKELKAMLTQWSDLSRSLAASVITKGNKNSQISDGEPAMLNEGHAKCFSDGIRGVFPSSKAAKVLQIRAASPHFNENPEESQIPKKRGRKQKSKSKGEQALSRCNCLEPLNPLRYHCQSCHETYDTTQEFETHREGKCLEVSFPLPGYKLEESDRLCLTQKKRIEVPMQRVSPELLDNTALEQLSSYPSQIPWKEKEQEFTGCASESQFQGKQRPSSVEKEVEKNTILRGEIPNLSPISVTFTFSETIRDRIRQIGSIADQGLPILPAPSFAPCFDPALKMRLAPCEKAGVSTEEFVSTGRNRGQGLSGTKGSSINMSGTLLANKIATSLHSCMEGDFSDRPENDSYCQPALCELNYMQDRGKNGAEPGEFRNKKTSISPAVHLTLHGNSRIVLQKLQSVLLEIEAALTDVNLELARSLSSRRRAWRLLVKAANSVYEMMEALILLEQMVMADQLKPFWGLWSSISASLKTSTLSALALRLYSLDLAIMYDVPSADEEAKSLDTTLPNSKVKKKRNCKNFDAKS